ncbi:MAG: 30S ribosomal protein S6 [Elusimicrobia bacterium]|nr:30S ribosomal protein S6 [Elusimicrobiota bacterium]
MNTYETLFVCPPELSTEKVDDILEKVKRAITREGGQIQKEDRWGLKRFAYSIRGHREGLYVHLEFAAPPSVTHALDQTFRVLEGVLRHIVLRVEAISPRRQAARKKERVGAAGAAGASPSHSQSGGASPSPRAGGWPERGSGRVGRYSGSPSGSRSSGGGRTSRGSRGSTTPTQHPDAAREEPQGGPST